jgi:hypothetical protein
MKIIFSVFLALIFSTVLLAQQVPDTNFTYKNENPAYSKVSGPVIMVDNFHNNFHTIDNRYKPFAKLLEGDGYVLSSYSNYFLKEGLEKCRILVISNALDSSNIETWSLPTPSAFTKTEISEIEKWVKSGGRLFLIADHMPFAGAANELAEAFGFEYKNCFAKDDREGMPERFCREDGSLPGNIITDGRNEKEKVDTVIAFTGSAFKIPDGAGPILPLGEYYTLYMPTTAWEFNYNTPKEPGNGYCQGAFMKYGKGKIVVFGEAAMFSAQLAGTGPNQRRAGFNSPQARQNIQLLLNIIHWLDED